MDADFVDLQAKFSVGRIFYGVAEVNQRLYIHDTDSQGRLTRLFENTAHDRFKCRAGSILKIVFF